LCIYLIYRIGGHVFITEAEEKNIIADKIRKSDITVNYTDHKKLKYFTVKVEGLFKCHSCERVWSSHMATFVVDLYNCKANKSGCDQRCKQCIESWVFPRFTEDRFEEAIDRVITKYWERKEQSDEDDDDTTVVDDNKRRGNPQAPHQTSLCRKCIKLGRPCN